MFNTSYIELSKSALKNNINFIRAKIGKEVKLSVVVKGNAYGHGIEEFVPMAEHCGVDHFSVFSGDEAYRVFQVKKKKSVIMIMGFIDDSDLEWAIRNKIQFYVFETGRLNAALKIAKKLNKQAIIHVEVETGMNRTGFTSGELDQVISVLKANPEHLAMEGLCTHYAGAESVSNYLRVQNQIKNFTEICKKFCDQDMPPKIRHTACSAAAINYPETLMDMARIGILNFGFWPSQETFIQQIKNNGVRSQDPLKRVISWKSKVMATKRVGQGEFVGYGTSFMASKDMDMAIVPVGYAYGYSRTLSNIGRVLIHGRRANIVGIINMNLMAVDIHHIKDVKRGDEVVLIGKQKKHQVSVASFSDLSNQLNYELLTRLPRDLPRKPVR